MAPVLLMTVAGCLNLAPGTLEAPVVDHAPTVDAESIAPEDGPDRIEVNIGEGCDDRLFGVGTVHDVDAEVLSVRFFMLFTDPDDPEGPFARQELVTNQLLPLESDPTTFQGPLLSLGRTKLRNEFRSFLNELLTIPGQKEKGHLLELIIADRPFIGQVDEATLPPEAGSVSIDWGFYIIDVACTTETL